MKDADNENFPLSFVTLSAATKNVTRYLRLDEKQDKESGTNPDTSSGNEERAREKQRYIDQRLRDLAAFERRSRGKN